MSLYSWTRFYVDNFLTVVEFPLKCMQKYVDILLIKKIQSFTIAVFP